VLQTAPERIRFGLAIPRVDWEHILYRAFGEAGELLYIGITNDLRDRFGQHERNTPWWYLVFSCEIERCPDRATLELAEISAIQAENPKYNRRRVTRRKHDGRWNDLPHGSKQDAVAQWLVLQIAQGVYDEAKKLPTYATIEELFDVSNITARTAYQRLSRIGLIISNGKGWYLSDSARGECVHSVSAAW